MDIKIDFKLSDRFSVVEKTIFRLVLNGFKDAQDLTDAMPLFSDHVIANSIRNLVNAQMISANLDDGILNLSDPIIAIIDVCYNNHFTMTLSTNSEKTIKNGGIIIDRDWSEETTALKEAILKHILPNVKMDIYSRSLDFIITEFTEESDNG